MINNMSKLIAINVHMCGVVVLRGLSGWNIINSSKKLPINQSINQFVVYIILEIYNTNNK